MIIKAEIVIIKYPIMRNVVFNPVFISKQLKGNYINIFFRQRFKRLQFEKCII